MIHKAYCSIEELPYWFSRSSVKFLGQTGWQKYTLKPIWVRLLGRSQLSNLSNLVCLRIVSPLHFIKLTLNGRMCHNFNSLPNESSLTFEYGCICTIVAFMVILLNKCVWFDYLCTCPIDGPVCRIRITSNKYKQVFEIYISCTYSFLGSICGSHIILDKKKIQYATGLVLIHLIKSKS